MLNGFFVIDKQEGWTSHDVVAKVRGILGVRRVGHTGTLDPLATGVLPVMVGRATRAAELLACQGKEYTARFRTGLTTDTQDITGTVLTTNPPETDLDKVRKAAAGFLGKGTQIPPMYSAIKLGGKKLYELARKGVEVERAPRAVEFSNIEVRPLGGGEFELDVGCSKGAYIRTLCHDIGLALGCGATMTALRRIRSGPFCIKDSVRLCELQEAANLSEAEKHMLRLDEVFLDLPEVFIDGLNLKRCLCGTPFETSKPDGRYRVYSQSGEFLMLGLAREGRMSTWKSFFEPQN